MNRFSQTILAAALAASISVHAHESDQLGKVSFPTSCDAKVQDDFERGVAMLHSYWFNKAGQTFKGVLEKDSSCAIAYWGIAIDLLNNTLAAPPSAKDAQEAWTMLEKARAVGAKTPRERAWIDAAAAYFRDHEKTPVTKRLEAYNAAMEQLVRDYPDDLEAKVFYALTLQASAPKSDVTYASQIKSAELLEKLYEQNPKHPGITHFLIHAYDYPPLADKGIPAAKRYAGLAPEVPHARHMPSHIYTVVGMWEDSIASNSLSLEIQPDYYHAYDFSVYAALQLAQDRKAKAMIEKAVATPVRGDRPVSLGTYTALASLPARYVIERGDWTGAAALPVNATKYPQADALTRFTRGIGMARSGDAAGAKRELAELDLLRAALQKADQAYWADRTDEQMRAVAAWIALAEGDKAKAAQLMKSAADSEDGSVKNVAMENRLYPMRELYAELLLESGQPDAALKEYEATLKSYPNRNRAIYGAARAAEATAAEYYAKLVTLTAKADSTRPETARAKSYLAPK